VNIDVRARALGETMTVFFLADHPQTASYDLILIDAIALYPDESAPAVELPPTATPTQAATAVPQVIIEFWADKTTIAPGQCAVLSWRVEGIREVYFQGAGVVGWGSQQVCPGATTTYNLRVIRVDGVEDNRYITIVVQ